MKKLRTQGEIMSAWTGDLSRPLISVCCITYNHRAYIEDALEGFLIQETDFPFEILIHDDASTDGTAAIVRDYVARYPLLFKAIYQTENQYSKGVRPMETLGAVARGQFVAVCEGDDYWTDPRKLMIQTSFLTNNPEYVISGHDAFVVDEQGQPVSDSKLPDDYKRDFSEEEMILGRAWVLTMSWVYRNLNIPYAPERRMVTNGDTFFLSVLGHYGKSHYHPDISRACYRVHGGGVWSSIDARNKRDAKINTFFWMYRYFLRTGEMNYAEYYFNWHARLVIGSLNRNLLLIELFKLFLPKCVQRLVFSIICKASRRRSKSSKAAHEL